MAYTLIDKKGFEIADDGLYVSTKMRPGRSIVLRVSGTYGAAQVSVMQPTNGFDSEFIPHVIEDGTEVVLSASNPGAIVIRLDYDGIFGLDVTNADGDTDLRVSVVYVVDESQL